MKRAASLLIITLLWAIALSPAALAAFSGSGGYSVDKVSYAADLRRDGSAVVTEEWTLTFTSAGAEGFTREIPLGGDNFSHILAVTDMSVSVDGESFAPSTDGENATEGTYTYSQGENTYTVNWILPSKGETHTFSLRYILNGAVKLYNGQAYLYRTVIAPDSSLLCRDFTITVTTPENCFSEDFAILQSGSFAGTRYDGRVVFYAPNSKGEVTFGFSMPPSLYDESLMTVIEDDYTVLKIAGGAVGGLALVIAAALVAYFVNYKKILRKRWERLCRKKAQEELPYELQSLALKKISPAGILKITLPGFVSGGDLFVVTLLDLVSRGYIWETQSGFDATVFTKDDPYKRPLSKGEKSIIALFKKGEWESLADDPESFYIFAKAFGKRVPFASPIWEILPSGRRLIRSCFEMKLSSKRHEFVYPQAVSQDFFTRGKYSVTDLVVSLVNEYYAVENDTYTPIGKELDHDIFMLRQVYERGERLYEKRIAAKKNKSPLKEDED